jgi:hypothetical protein
MSYPISDPESERLFRIRIGIRPDQNVPDLSFPLRYFVADLSLPDVITICIHFIVQRIVSVFQMYYQCIHQRLYHLTPAEYEDFTSIIIHARKVIYSWKAYDEQEQDCGF